MDDAIKYLIYARKSSEDSDRQTASIPSQVKELTELARRGNLNVVEVLEEEKSAKKRGRPVFARMINDIERGYANGIICWKLDRLSRNPYDSGFIGGMLQDSKICHIKTFERDYFPADHVLLMNLEFGMANQFILDLSPNTKRGLRSKIQNGWLPHKPPLGYLNNKYNQPGNLPIYPDPLFFPIMKKLWRILLEKRCSVEQLFDRAKEIGLKMNNGTKITRANFYRLFRNPFYYGSFLWQGQIYPGKHESMITRAEFDLAQQIINGKSSPRVHTHVFAFTGLIHCGECGGFITAEEKTKYQKNGNVHEYFYYRCGKNVDRGCTQKPISGENLERQIMEVLGQIEIPSSFHEWAMEQLREMHKTRSDSQVEIYKVYQKSLSDCIKKNENLLDMRLDGEITPEEFVAKKKELEEERCRLEGLMKEAMGRTETWLDRAEQMLSFAASARNRFENGSLEDKRQILSCLGLNLTLTNRKLNVDLDKSFFLLKKIVPKVQAIKNRLEPQKDELYQGVMVGVGGGNEKWGG